MNILYINHYAGSLQYGMEFRPYYLAREWQKQRHHVEVVGGSYSHLRHKNPKGSGVLWEENVEGIHYTWIRTLTYRSNGIMRLLSVLHFVMMLFVFAFYFRKKRPDIVIASSTYPLDVLPAKLIARISKAKLIHEVHDLWPLTLTEIGGLSKWNPFVILLQWAENYSYRNVDRVVSMLETAFPYMEKHGLTSDRFVSVPNGIVVEDWGDIEQALDSRLADLIKDIKSRGHILIGYAGGMGVANSVPYLVQALKALNGHDVSLVLVGDGPDRSQLEKVVRAENIQNVYFFGTISKKEIPAFLSQVDITFIGAPKSALYRFGVSPNKLLDYMMAGKPVLYAIESGNNWVMDSQAGYALPSENSAAIVEAIKNFKQLSLKDREAMGDRGRRFVTQEYLYPNLAKKFLAGL